ncbi:hypothetical protein LU293_05155 [Moraxella nasovis]|uniref:hypothetical protein n=1 Tax=Moraxella nasovis TaxID=2904121 RepID=UPI001F6039DA|nr:hypothetical protein [Moraxella nasovis]UNU72513.1 hypothetical protein LU293_05155 [Moraxella nasovis]
MLRLPKIRLPYVLAKHCKNKPISRCLTCGEKLLCRTVFGDYLKTDDIRIIACPYVFWQSDDIIIAPNGNLYVPKKHYKADYSVENTTYRTLFIHEMAHVFQHQQGINVLLKGAFLQSLHYLSLKKFNPYRYTLDKQKSFWAYTIEQQGKICEDIYLGKLDNIVCERQPKPYL